MKHSSLLVAIVVFSLFPCAGQRLAGQPAKEVLQGPPGQAIRPVGHWLFDGDLRDRSGQGNDAQAKVPAFTASPQGQALSFRSGAAPVVVPDAMGLRLAPGFRIECRVRFAALPPGSPQINVAVKGEHNRGEYMLRVNPDAEGGDFGFFVNFDGWEPRVRSGRRVQPGVWYHVAAGWDGQAIWLAVNGEVTREARSGLPMPTDDPLCLGPFEGAIDELRIDNPRAGSMGVAHWPFDGDLRDASGHGHDLVGVGRSFAAGRSGQALLVNKNKTLSVPNDPDFQLAPGFRVACSVLFKDEPSGITPILVKEGEYQLRVNPPQEGGHLSFFVNLNGWEPRVSVGQRVKTGVWYRVSAQWDGLALKLEVNGEQARIVRSGVVRPTGNPLVIGAFNGLIDDLQIENPKRPVLQVQDFTQANTVLRAGRPERLTATIRNHGSEATNCAVTLKLPPGVTLAGRSSATLQLGTLPTGAERVVEWTVQAAAGSTATAGLRLTGNGFAPVTVQRVLAFFPLRDPDLTSTVGGSSSSGSSAKTYYVDSVRGNNTHVGTSPEAPWLDFTNINGKTLGPGERLLIKRGSVINQELVISASGAAGAWAEIGAYGTGARPSLHRNGDIGDRCVLVRDPNYLRIRSLRVSRAGKGLIVHYSKGGHRGLVIEDCIAHHIEGLYRLNSHGIPEWRDREGAGDDGLHSSAGIAVSGAHAEDIIVRDCEMFQCSWGFFLKGDGVVVDRVYCHDNNVFNTSPHPALVGVRRSYLQNSILDASGWHAFAGTMGIMLVDPQGLIIRNCHFRNQPDSGSHDQGGIDFENQGNGCLIERCTFQNNAGAAIEVLGLKVPQPKNLEIAHSRFIRNNTAHKLGPAEIYIWGKSPSPDVCCSTGNIHDNGYVLHPGVKFFVNEAPKTTRWTLRDNTEYASAEELDRAMPHNNPPVVDAGPDLWLNQPTVRLSGTVKDDGRPATRLKVSWEVLEGPGVVTFQDAGAATTGAEFSAPGDYRLRLVADDGELWLSDMVAVHVLPPGATTGRAWEFNTPLNKEGWIEANLGTRMMEWKDQPWPCVSHPVKYVAGGQYIVAVEASTDARLESADNLRVDLARNQTIAIRLQNHTPATRMRLRFTTGTNPAWDDAHAKSFSVIANDNGLRVYTMNMRDIPGWTGRLKQLRLDLATGTPLTGTCRIDYVWIGNLPRE